MTKTKLTSEQKAILEDFKAFIEFGIDNNLEFYNILGTLAHDVGGLFHDDEMFLPRTSGYAKHRDAEIRAAVKRLVK